MQLDVRIDGDHAVAEASDLKNWIHRERIRGLTSVAQHETPPGPGEQGPTLLALLGVVLGAQATVELVRSIHRWIETRRRKIIITIERGDQKLVIDCENPPDIDALISRAAALA